MNGDPNKTLPMIVKANATQTFGAIPKEKLGDKIARTAIGLLLIGAAAGVRKLVPDAPWYVPIGLLLVGAHIASGELVGKTVKFFVGIGLSVVKREPPA